MGQGRGVAAWDGIGGLMVEGSCLCGAVRFGLSGELSQIELCHCAKCRKAYGAAFAATLYLRAEGFRWLRGEDQVATFDAPIEASPPAYRHSFCRRCGSPLPLLWPALPFVEVPVATLDDPVDVRPAYQMFECQRLPWMGEVHGLRWHQRAAPSHEKVLKALF